MFDKLQMDAIFSPKSIAVIGASKKVGSIGNQVLQNIIDGGYEGKLYPINPTATEICARKAYPTIKDVPGDVDMAVFCVPQKAVYDVAVEVAKKGVKGWVVITSGYSETGNRKGEEELLALARSVGARIVGPNIVGVLMNGCKANASFAPCLPYPGKAAIISQSGALIIGLDMATFVRRLGTSSMILARQHVRRQLRRLHRLLRAGSQHELHQPLRRGAEERPRLPRRRAPGGQAHHRAQGRRLGPRRRRRGIPHRFARRLVQDLRGRLPAGPRHPGP